MLRSARVQLLFVTALLGVAPLLMWNTYLWHLLTLLCIYGILAYSLNFSLGYAGHLAFGWAGFWGVGAYASSLLALNFGWSFWLTMPIACVLAGIVSFLIGLVCFKAKGIYFSLIHMCFGLVLMVIALNWMGLTNGPLGLVGIPLPSIKLPFLHEIRIVAGLPFYYLTMMGLLLVMFSTQRIVTSPVGRSFIAVRENEDLAQSIGINLFKANMTAFCMGAVFAGLAGVLYAHYFRTIDPQVMAMSFVVDTFLMVLVGGRGTLYGPLIGASFYSFIPEVLRLAGTTRYIIFGTVLILFIIFLPGGIWPTLVRGFERLRSGRMVKETR